MKNTVVNSSTGAARELVLNVAEALFQERGYTAVSMRDIAEALGMRQASIYYHVPEGKEQLFVEVTERALARHQAGLTDAITRAGDEVVDQLTAAADWLISQSPLHLLSMLETDMLAINSEAAERLTWFAYQSLFAPIKQIFLQGQLQGKMRSVDADHLSGAFLAIMDGISYTSHAGHTPAPMSVMAEIMIDVLWRGLKPE